MNERVLLLPGDGIGPEVVSAARQVLEAVRPDLQYEEVAIGLGALRATGRPYPADLVDIARESDAVLLGAVGGEQDSAIAWDERPEAGLFALRQGLDLYANLRPVRLLAPLSARSVLRPDLAADVDVLIVRELVGGAYFGAKGTRDGRTFDTIEYSEPEVERIVRRAFEFAALRRSHVTSIDKANILRTSVLWRSVAERIAAAHPAIRCDHLLVDNAAMQLLQRPASFDVIVTENLFGDILSDEAAALVGGLGLLPSASLGAPGTPGLFEPVHGSAPDIAGAGIANPTGAVLSAAMLLRHGCGDAANADRIDAAVFGAFADGVRTPDLGGSHGTAVMTAAIIEGLG